MKRANVTPVFKADAKDVVENYRSISLLSIPSKCHETIAHNATYAHVAHGFIKVTKHADVEVSGQTVKTCLIKHRIKLHTQRTMGHKLTRVTFSARDFSMAEGETSQVVIQRFKLKN